MVVYPAERPHDVSGSRVVFQADILSTDKTSILISIELPRQRANETVSMKQS